MHKRARLTPLVRKEIYERWKAKKERVVTLAEAYQVSPPTIYKILGRSREKDFRVRKSTNKRYICLQYGMKRLAKIEKQIEEKLKKQAKRYNKKYPGEMVHGDTKRLPLLKGESSKGSREYLFVAIDDYSRELFAGVLPDKTQQSAERFLRQVEEECAYTIEEYYTDNGKEYRGDEKKHAFMQACRELKIEQRFTRVKTPRTNGKAERVIRTLMEQWHEKEEFHSRAHRVTSLKRFVNWYNTVKPHKGIEGRTPFEQLIHYFYPLNL